ncbi:hypothetical protein [Micromonospora sp. DT227]|uniref:hypothetical protein n=1 Tax=Micromonospora sp. DT227 TaxID=3393433 RepID=UPI003CEF6776
MPDRPNYNRGGYLPTSLVPIRLHPDECVVRADKRPWRCVRADHQGRPCHTEVEAEEER